MSLPNKTLGYRWTICALIFAATTVNYLDRNVLGLLKPLLSQAGVFGPDKANQELNYSTVVICFQMAYAIGMVFIGRFVDVFGTRRGYAWSITGWSLAAIGHAFGHHTWSFGLWRALLGVTEAGNFPAANKAVAEWFPKKERAFATGVYNSGANIGAIVAPLSVPFIAATMGWEWAFILTGLIGFVWLFFWLTFYSSPEEELKEGKMTREEYDYITSDVDENPPGSEVRVSWFRLLAFRQTWAFFFGKFLTDPIWWFYLFWLPSYLSGENARKASQYLASHQGFSGPPDTVPGVISWPLAIAVVYTVATFGSIFGGLLPKWMINRGMDANQARKLSMFFFALVPLLVLLASRAGEVNTWYAVIIVSLACAAHQAWSANIFATVSDMFPKIAVASVTGIGGMAGAIGGILIARLAGALLQKYTVLGRIEAGYGILFIICGSSYLTAWVVMQILVPKFKQVRL